MIAPPPIDRCQRWLGGRASYRPAREVVDTRRLEVIRVDISAIRAFIETHHYSKTTPPACRAAFALYQSGELAGGSIFTDPFTDETITNAFPTLEADDGVELSRFVLLDEVGANGETHFLGRCFADLRGEVAGVVSFSDPQPRTDQRGEQVFPGHVGTIYQAMNARYRGLSDRRTIRILPDGTTFSNFESGKIRRKLSGWQKAAAKLVSFGAEPMNDNASRPQRIAWLDQWRGALTRGVRHPGNHRYTWLLDSSRRREMPHGPERAYPKRVAA